MSGHVSHEVDSSDVPSCAPTMEYVATPDGSSSAAPVMTPGPRTDKKRRSGFLFSPGAGALDFTDVPLRA